MSVYYCCISYILYAENNLLYFILFNTVVVFWVIMYTNAMFSFWIRDFICVLCQLARCWWAGNVSNSVLKIVEHFTNFRDLSSKCYDHLCFKTSIMGTCKMRNEIETKRNKSKRNSPKRNETKRNNSKWNKTYFNETISWGNTRQKLNEKHRESII